MTNKWHAFNELFCSKLSRIDLMNESSSYFFFTVQEVLRDDLLLTIAKLTDPPKSIGNKKTSHLGALHNSYVKTIGTNTKLT
ncbi:MAG: hypothetical protein JJE09_14035 [Bacteroidia bacterium]|nr:hypothetical protein [Bacteroidia bacterium]